MTIGFARFSSALAAGAIFVLLTAGTANAAPIVLTSSQDAFLGIAGSLGHTPQPGGLNIGFLTVNFSDASPNYALIQFDVSSLSGHSINSASLALHHLMNTKPTAIFGVFQNTSAWSASTATYNSPPTFNPVPIVTKNILSVGGHPGQHGTIESFDITSLVQDWVDGSAANYGISFMRTNDSNPFLYFAGSKYLGGVDAPQLIVDATPIRAVPEPMTLALFGAGFAGLIGMGRRRNLWA